MLLSTYKTLFNLTSSSLPPLTCISNLQTKQLLQLLDRVLRSCDSVSDSAAILEDLVVVTALESLVTEEVDGGVVDAADVLLSLDVLETVSLVPAGREDVE